MPAHTCSTSRFGQRQGGFAMIALIALIAIMSAYLVANALARTNAELANTREQRSMNALRQAKAALIAYAASEEWQQYRSGPTNFQPGALPCPDSNDSGNSAGICSAAANRIGRLPWKTLGIDDLRDASGERLWYALSANFRKLSGTTVINSDTQGQLTVIGIAPASNIVAIVFAPGEAIQGQNRDPANALAHNSPANYLEGYNAAYDTFTSTAFPSDSFNDRLLVITQADLMSVVEPVVAAMIERDVKPYLQTYLTQWGAFPFPATFAPGPGTSTTRAQSASCRLPPPPRMPGPAARVLQQPCWACRLEQGYAGPPPCSCLARLCPAGSALSSCFSLLLRSSTCRVRSVRTPVRAFRSCLAALSLG